MFIIGIIANSSYAKQIKREIEQSLRAEIILINSKSIENIRNIKFDIIIMQNVMESLKEKKAYLREILKNTKYLLLNADLNVESELFEKIKAKILTYGLKQKSTITISGIQYNPAMISIQRAFKNVNGEIIEQQEIPMQLKEKGSNNIYNSLIKTAIINICGGKTC